jgi:small subunit ribosomal protein S8
MHSLNNFFSALQNGHRAKKHCISVPYSKIVWQILDILYTEGFICGFKKKTELKNSLIIYSPNDKHAKIKILLKYTHNEPAIKKIKQISCSGLRIYKKANIIQNCSSINFYILSTSKGLMSNRKASSLYLGGEVLCEIL